MCRRRRHELGYSPTSSAFHIAEKTQLFNARLRTYAPREAPETTRSSVAEERFG
jgi:hypothetical protein